MVILGRNLKEDRGAVGEIELMGDRVKVDSLEYIHKVYN